MPNTNQALFIVIIVIFFTLALIGVYLLMNKASNRRRELFDLEQRLQAQEQQLKMQIQKNKEIDMYQPAMVKQGHQIVIMTPHKKTKRESLLEKIYGSRNASSPPYSSPTALPTRPSAIRPPSFLPMQEKHTVHPPAYDDYGTSVPVIQPSFSEMAAKH